MSLRDKYAALFSGGGNAAVAPAPTGASSAGAAPAGVGSPGARTRPDALGWAHSGPATTSPAPNAAFADGSTFKGRVVSAHAAVQSLLAVDLAANGSQQQLQQQQQMQVQQQLQAQQVHMQAQQQMQLQLQQQQQQQYTPGEIYSGQGGMSQFAYSSQLPASQQGWPSQRIEAELAASRYAVDQLGRTVAGLRESIASDVREQFRAIEHMHALNQAALLSLRTDAKADDAARTQVYQQADRVFAAVTELAAQTQADRRWELTVNERQTRQFETMMTGLQDVLRRVCEQHASFLESSRILAAAAEARAAPPPTLPTRVVEPEPIVAPVVVPVMVAADAAGVARVEVRVPDPPAPAVSAAPTPATTDAPAAPTPAATTTPAKAAKRPRESESVAPDTTSAVAAITEVRRSGRPHRPPAGRDLPDLVPATETPPPTALTQAKAATGRKATTVTAASNLKPAINMAPAQSPAPSSLKAASKLVPKPAPAPPVAPSRSHKAKPKVAGLVLPSGPPKTSPSGPPMASPSGPPKTWPSGPPKTWLSVPPKTLPSGQPKTRPSGPPKTMPSGPPKTLPSGPPKTFTAPPSAPAPKRARTEPSPLATLTSTSTPPSPSPPAVVPSVDPRPAAANTAAVVPEHVPPPSFLASTTEAGPGLQRRTLVSLEADPYARRLVTLVRDKVAARRPADV